MRIDRSVIPLISSSFVPRGPADRELEWFFTLAESDMGDRSNYMESLVHVAPHLDGDTTMDDRAEAAHAQRTMLRWLRELDDFDAGALEAAYVARPWPLRLREELGRLTGVVVRLAVVKSGLPADAHRLATLEQRTALQLNEALCTPAGEASVRGFVDQATPILRQAFTAYERERGGKARPILRGVS